LKYTKNKFSLPLKAGWESIGDVASQVLPWTTHDKEKGKNRLNREIKLIRTTTVMLFRSGSRCLLDTQGKLPTHEYDASETVRTSAGFLVKLTTDSGWDQSRANYVGYFSQGYLGEKTLPVHHLVSYTLDHDFKVGEGFFWVEPSRLPKSHALFGVIEQSFLELVLAMEPEDELGWGDNGPIIWEEKKRGKTPRMRKHSAPAETQIAA
jgi:hypothetical protein